MLQIMINTKNKNATNNDRKVIWFFYFIFTSGGARNFIESGQKIIAKRYFLPTNNFTFPADNFTFSTDNFTFPADISFLRILKS